MENKKIYIAILFFLAVDLMTNFIGGAFFTSAPNKNHKNRIGFNIGACCAFAQTAGSEDPYREESLKFRFFYNFPERVFHVYKCEINTQINRVFSDTSKQTFTRKEEVYITLRNPTAKEDDFAMVNTGIDSIRYEFSDGTNTYKWWSQSDEDDLLDNQDFYKFFAMIGRFFVTTISPYYEVALISGNLLEIGRNNIEEMADSVERFIWKQALADDNLKLYTDLNRGVIENGQFARDSSWKSKFTIPIEGINYTCDTATTTFYLYDGKSFHLKAEMPFMKPSSDKALVVGIDDFVAPVDSANSSSEGYWDIAVTPRGVVQSVDAEFSTKAARSINKVKFVDNIKTKIKFSLINTYKWRD